MTGKEFYNKMQECKLVSSQWKNLLSLLQIEMKDTDNAEQMLKLFSLYFSLVDDGNTYMCLDKNGLHNKFEIKIESLRIENQEEEKAQVDYNELLSEIDVALDFVNALGGLSVVGDNKLFVIKNNRLFASKYYHAVDSIKKSADRLFKNHPDENSIPSFRVEDYTQNIALESEQKDVVNKGLQANLIVTGGPGTGKTTSITFLLLGLLSRNPNLNVYLTAPSGKASDRIGESIGEEIKHIKGVDQTILKIIVEMKGTTIHSLLKIDRDTNRFVYNKNNQFAKNSVFIIDEASMIDVCLFASLLEAIPNEAQVFILGDKNQLPSVECGAVFSELLSRYASNVVELKKSQRFPQGSEIYELSEKVNQGNLEADEMAFISISSFSIEENTDLHKVFYFDDLEKNNKEIVNTVTDVWYKKYFDGFQQKCNNIQESDINIFGDIIAISEQAKILCAQNESARGTNAFNRAILDTYYNGKKISGFYPGEVLMVKKNLKALDLFNGDCGVTVKFKNDDTLYFMIKKTGDKLKLDKGKKNNMLFRLEGQNNENFYFYPVRMIGLEDIASAFAITIHKSQGSGYKNVAIILPKTEKHPLLNRQLVYTAITRTKGNTYIISNKNNLVYASQNVLARNTGIM